jgi:phosphatidylethanolamine/phosphatidyl-N-methylethanolamine N-methyltransferase
MNWYDLFSPLYDRTFQKKYRPYWQAAVKALDLKLGDTVLDIGCGTGLNFEAIINEIGPQGKLIGVDFSDKMLARARDRINTHGWENVHVLQRDARKLTVKDFEPVIGEDAPIDRILTTLGFSVFPDWQAVFDNAFGLLRSGGRYAIMDVYNTQKTLRIRLLNLRVQADISRRVWEPLKEKSVDYTEERYTVVTRGTVVVASGNKP